MVAAVEDFRGAGTAYFESETLSDYATSLTDYPLVPHTNYLLESGEVASNGVFERLVSMRVSQVGLRGQIGVDLHLEQEFQMLQHHKYQRRLDVELLTDYGNLRSFARDLSRLAEGSLEEAELWGPTFI